ncbi:MAG: TMEM165/GDT1 family protein [Alphaproteobacteria bacterium]|nr:TMEM165/GDT1 family protein [Alphaproteobacteria bacterium]
MESFLVSTGVVAVAEIGDKTQLLAMLLAARFRKPVPIIVGILFATLANHALAAWAGGLAAAWMGPQITRWILGVSFLAMAGWMMIPDKAPNENAGPGRMRSAGAFLATLVAFFLVEIGDKTQIATIALAARYDAVLVVTLGTTLGMMTANVPAVLLGEAAARKIPMRLAHGIAAAVFALLGLAALLGLGGDLFDQFRP